MVTRNGYIFLGCKLVEDATYSHFPQSIQYVSAVSRCIPSSFLTVVSLLNVNLLLEPGTERASVKTSLFLACRKALSNQSPIYKKTDRQRKLNIFWFDPS